MSVTVVPSGHFQGGRGINVAPTTGDDVRSLEDVLNEYATEINSIGSTLGTVTSPFLFKGEIAAAADFPLIADVEAGWTYTTTAEVTDNGGATRTNTGVTFPAKAEIAWDGTAWVVLGVQPTVALAVATPVAVGETDSVVFVDTATIGGPSVVNLPAATAALAGTVVLVTDATGDAAAHNVAVTPDGTDNIDGANVAYDLVTNWEFVKLQCIGLGEWKVLEANRRAVAATADGLMTAADKTKLDGVEALADVTDATNVAAAGALMDSLFTAQGQILYEGAAGAAALAPGAAGDLLTSGGAGADPSWSNAIPTAVAAIVDDHVTCHVAGLDIKTDEQDKSAALSGDVAKSFCPMFLVLKVVTNVGALNADGTINVGTAADGSDIASGIALTGLTAVGAARVVFLGTNTASILGNATLHANVESAESGAGTLELDVYVIGRQV